MARPRMFTYAGDELRLLRRGASLGDRARIMRLMLHLHTRVGRARRLTSRLPRPRAGSFDIQLADGPNLRLRRSDWVMIEVFGVGAYELELAPHGAVRSVLDIGANVGMASVYLARRFPSARFVCVEPVRQSFELLEENLRRNVGEALALNVAAVGEPGTYHVDEGPQPAEARVLAGPGADGGTVQALTITQILARAEMASVDLMKVDIEGGERALLESAAAWAPAVGTIVGEVHRPLTVAEVERRLAEHGFRPLPRPDEPRFADVFLVARPRP